MSVSTETEKIVINGSIPVPTEEGVKIPAENVISITYIDPRALKGIDCMSIVAETTTLENDKRKQRGKGGVNKTTDNTGR